MIEDAKTNPFTGKLPDDLGGAVSVPMGRMGGRSARRPAPLPGARLSPSPEGTMLRIIFGLSMILRDRRPGFEGLRAGSQRTLRRGGKRANDHRIGTGPRSRD